MPDPPKLPPVATAPLSVLLPAHNAAVWLDEVLAGWTTYLATLNRDYEILLVDDGSKDDTEERASTAARANPRLVVLRHPIRLGYGACLRTGLTVARISSCSCRSTVGFDDPPPSSPHTNVT